MTSQLPLAAQLAASSTPHPMGAWTMASILCLCFLAILGGAIVITTMLDRRRHAGTERARQASATGTQTKL